MRSQWWVRSRRFGDVPCRLCKPGHHLNDPHGAPLDTWGSREPKFPLEHFNDTSICRTEKETQNYRTVFWTLWEKARVGCFRRTASKHVYYLGWNRSPAQVGCMRQALGPGALGRPSGSGWRGRWEGGSGWGTHVNPWLFHFNVWQNSLQIKNKIIII